MTEKKKSPQPAQPKTEAPKAIPPATPQKEAEADTLIHLALRPTVQAGVTLLAYNKGLDERSIKTLVSDLDKQCESVGSGDLARAESMLTAQAHTLDAIFNRMARVAVQCEHLDNLDVNLRLALKAQSQCRATLETLAAIKNPHPVAFVRQANISHGPQQVNNGVAQASDPARAENTEIRQNELLEASDGKRLDTGKTNTAIHRHTEVAAVAPIDRAKNR